MKLELVVKPLHWIEDRAWCFAKTPFTMHMEGPQLIYAILERGDGLFYISTLDRVVSSMEEARRACQLDFEGRVLSVVSVRATHHRHFHILVEALAEIKSVCDRESQKRTAGALRPIADIVRGCLSEITELHKESK